MKILKRVLIALMSASAITCAFFVDLFKFRASSNIVMYVAEENLNLIDFIKMTQKYSGAKVPDVLLDFKVNIILILFFFALVILSAVVLIILSCCLKDSAYTKSTSILSILGIFSVICIRAAFSPITNAVKSGTISIGSLAGAGALDSFIKLDLLALGTAPYIILILFTLIFIINAIIDTFAKKSK